MPKKADKAKRKRAPRKHQPGVDRVLRFRAHNPTPAQVAYLERCAAGYHAAWNHSVAIQKASTRLFGEPRTWTDKNGDERVDHAEPRVGTADHDGMKRYVALARRLPTFKSVTGGFRCNGIEFPWESVPAQIVQFAMAKLDGNWRSYWGHIKNGNFDAKPPSFRRYGKAKPYWGMPSQQSSDSPLSTRNVFRTDNPGPTVAGMPSVTSTKAGWVQLPNVQKRDWRLGEDDLWVRVVAHRPIPADARITNQAWSYSDGHWWCLLTISQVIPDHAVSDRPIVVGVDRGINKSAYTFSIQPSTGEVTDSAFARTPGLTPGEDRRMKLLERSLARKHRQNSPACFDTTGNHVKGQCDWKHSGKNVSGRAKRTADEIARLRHKAALRRQDHVEQQSRFLVESADVIAFEHLPVQQMMKSAKGTAEAPGKNVRQKAGLNRSIGEQAWATIKTRTEQKAKAEALKGRTVQVVEVPAPYTSQTCSLCRAKPRKENRNGEHFECLDCGFTDDADRNAARNIALLAIKQLQIDGTLTAEGMRNSGTTHRQQPTEGRPVCNGALDDPEIREGENGTRAETIMERAS